MWIFRSRATRGSWTVLLDSEISCHAVGKPRVLGHDRPEDGAGAMRPRSAGSLLTVLVLVLVLVSLLQSQAGGSTGTGSQKQDEFFGFSNFSGSQTLVNGPTVARQRCLVVHWDIVDH